MASQDDIRRIASKLPGAVEGEDRFGFSVLSHGKAKGFVWEWAERVDPRKPRILNPEVVAIVVPNLAIKEALLQSGSPGLFTEPHYDGFPAVLVRLTEIDSEELKELVIEGWRCKAPTALVAEFDAEAES